MKLRENLAPGNMPAYLHAWLLELVRRVNTISDGADLSYTPAVLADWDSSTDPGDIDDALDQLAERVTDLEGLGGGSGTKTYAVLTPMTSQPPASNFATLDTRNSIAVLDFEDTTEQSATWVFVIPEAASLGSGLKIRIHWMATTATTGDARWGAKMMRLNTDLDSDSYDTAAEATSTTNGTSGIITTTEITLTTIDSVAAGEACRLCVYRDTGDAADTLSGAIELVAVEVRSAA